jgi:hypothetical protein
VQTELRGTSDLRETGGKARVLDLIISHRSDPISFINSFLSLCLVGHRIRLLLYPSSYSQLGCCRYFDFLSNLAKANIHFNTTTFITAAYNTSINHHAFLNTTHHLPLSHWRLSSTNQTQQKSSNRNISPCAESTDLR